MIIENILLALSPYMLFVCLIGVTLGILWGAMPGLSTTMAMALLIGLSAGMEQYVAIMFMLGVYTGSVFGGAISAVLINIPGTPDAVPTWRSNFDLGKCSFWRCGELPSVAPCRPAPTRSRDGFQAGSAC
jgi:TctA family transporter